MRSYRRSILLKSVKGSYLRALIKETTWNLKATNQFSANGQLKPTSLYCRTYDMSIELSSWAMVRLVIWDTISPIMTSMCCYQRFALYVYVESQFNCKETHQIWLIIFECVSCTPINVGKASPHEIQYLKKITKKYGANTKQKFGRGNGIFGTTAIADCRCFHIYEWIYLKSQKHGTCFALITKHKEWKAHYTLVWLTCVNEIRHHWFK